MLSKDFYGKSGFIWWVGLVEDNFDPLKLGSVRVRIIGIHSEDTSLVPTESLPYAQVLLPTTGTGDLSPPRIGDWVFGFFQDGEYAQIPVIIGIFSGIESVQSRTLYETIVVKRGGSSNFPRPGQVDRVNGEPVAPRIGRGVLSGTTVDATNQLRSHACDISPEVKHATSHLKAQFGVVVETIRKAIRAILTAMGFGDPSGVSTFFIQVAKEVSRLLTMINNVLTQITELTQLLVGIGSLVGAIIRYLLSLPDKIKKFFEECIQKFQELIKIVTDIFASPSTGGTFSGLTDFKSTVTTISNQLNQAKNSLISIASFPSAFAEAVVNPSSSDTTAVEKIMNGYMNNVITTSKTIYDRNMMSSSTQGVIV